jgi:hypothetical protein
MAESMSPCLRLRVLVDLVEKDHAALHLTAYKTLAWTLFIALVVSAIVIVCFGSMRPEPQVAISSFAMGYAIIAIALSMVFNYGRIFGSWDRHDRYKRITKSDEFARIDNETARLLLWALICTRERTPMKLTEILKAAPRAFTEERLLYQAVGV